MAWTERYATVAGAGLHDGTSEANAWTLAEAITNAVAGHRVNVKAGTHTLAVDRNFAGAGTDASAIWWRGYNSAIGDLETSNTFANFPLLQVTGAASQNIVNGAYNWFSDLAFESASTAVNLSSFHVTGVGCRIHHCYCENLAANANSAAVSGSGTSDGLIISGCRIKSTTTATNAAIIAANGVGTFFGNRVEGAGLLVGSAASVAFNIFDDPSGVGVTVSAGILGVAILNNSFYSCGSDSIQIGSALTQILIANNIFSESGGYAINSSAAISSAIHIIKNLFHSSTSGHLNNILENQVFGSITDDSSSPYTNAASDDFSLKSTSNGKGAGFGLFLGDTATGYPDVGAVQRQESGGSTQAYVIGG